MFVEATDQLFQDINAVLDAALKRDGLAALQTVGRVIAAFGQARPMVEPASPDAGEAGADAA